MAQDDLESRLDEEGDKRGFFETLRSLSFSDYVSTICSGIAAGIFGGGLLNVVTSIGSYLATHYILHRQKGFTKRGIKDECYLATAMTPVLYSLFSWLKKIENPFFKVPVGLGLIVPVRNLVFLGLQYIVKYVNVKKVLMQAYRIPLDFYRTSIKGKYWKSLKNTWKFLSAPLVAVWYLPMEYQLAGVSANRMIYRGIMERSSRATQYGTPRN